MWRQVIQVYIIHNRLKYSSFFALMHIAHSINDVCQSVLKNNINRDVFYSLWKQMNSVVLPGRAQRSTAVCASLDCQALQEKYPQARNVPESRSHAFDLGADCLRISPFFFARRSVRRFKGAVWMMQRNCMNCLQDFSVFFYINNSNNNSSKNNEKLHL